jgi:hypothetical protein
MRSAITTRRCGRRDSQSRGQTAGVRCRVEVDERTTRVLCLGCKRVGEGRRDCWVGRWSGVSRRSGDATAWHWEDVVLRGVSERMPSLSRGARRSSL